MHHGIRLKCALRTASMISIANIIVITVVARQHHAAAAAAAAARLMLRPGASQLAH